MSNINSVQTKKGTELPLMKLKGKDYMMVAHRIVWFNEEAASFDMQSEYLVLTEERAVIKAVVRLYDKDGKLLKQGIGTKSETKKDFPDFIEKAETGAIGRAITMMGFGTAYALADLDEGQRIIDSPITNDVRTAPQKPTVLTPPVEKTAAPETTPMPSPVKKSTFRKPSPAPAAEAPSPGGNGWD